MEHGWHPRLRRSVSAGWLHHAKRVRRTPDDPLPEPLDNLEFGVPSGLGVDGGRHIAACQPPNGELSRGCLTGVGW